MEKRKTYTIRELRKICQGTGPALETQTLVGLLGRVFSIYFTWAFIKTPITPNRITFISTAIYLIGVGLFAFGEQSLMYVGFALFILATFLDGADGEVFRFRRYQAGYGSTYVEPISHDIMYGVMFVPIAFGAFLITGNPYLLLFGAAAAVFKLLFRLAEMRFFYGVTALLPTRGHMDTTKRFDREPGWKRLAFIGYRQIATSTGLLLPLFIAIVFNRVDLFIIFYGILFFLLWAALFARQMMRFQKVSRQVLEQHAYAEEARERFKRKKLIIFDLDGTLLDSMSIFADIASYLMAWKHGITRSEAREKYVETSGAPFFRQLEEIFPGHQYNSEVADLFETRKIAATDHLEITPDEKEALLSITKKGYAVAISSNNFQENVDRFVSFSGLPFNYALGFKEGYAKGKDHFDYIFEKEKISPEDAVFVGDSLSDMERAHGCGVDFVGKTGTFSREDFENKSPRVVTVRSIEELNECL